MNGASQRSAIANQQPVNQQIKSRFLILARYTALAVLLFMIAASANAQYTRKELRRLRKGKAGIDTSFVYQLPFLPGKSYWMVQGYLGWFTHGNRLALDFKMNTGTTICAARGGVVVRVRQDGQKGGLKKKYRNEGNNIVIQHSDGSRAGYWHLQYQGALVRVGDTVKQGQPIGLSGRTGYASGPHLHFLVWKFNRNGGWQQVPTRFKTQHGIVYLRAWCRYKGVAVAD